MKIVFFKMPTHLLSLEKDYGYFEKNLKEAFSKSNHYKKTSLFKNSDDMVKAIKKINFEVEQVMLVTRSISLRNLYKIINELKGKVYEIKIIPNIKNFEFMDFFLEDQNGHFYLEYKQVIKNPLMDFSKRIFDLIIAIFFIIIFSPIFVIVSLLIRLESGGPIFFKQERIGLNGQVFNVIKFRSMYKNAEERLEKMLRSDSEIKSEYEKFAKLEKDPRITKIGSFIRKYSIDEIPQFFNVLMGDMSLVGPRPYMKSELKKMGWKKRVIINARPGITGLWQISGRSNLTFQERVNLEKYYIESWNLFRDFVILLLTPIAVFKSKGK